jgi:hypothetical protein
MTFEDLGVIVVPLLAVLIYWLLGFDDESERTRGHPARVVDEAATLDESAERPVAQPPVIVPHPDSGSGLTADAVAPLFFLTVVGGLVLLLRSIGIPHRY